MHSGILPIRVHRKLVCRAAYTILQGRTMVNKLNLAGFNVRRSLLTHSTNRVLSCGLRNRYISEFLCLVSKRVTGAKRGVQWLRNLCCRLQQITVVLCIWCIMPESSFSNLMPDYARIFPWRVQSDQPWCVTEGRAVRGAEMDRTNLCPVSSTPLHYVHWTEASMQQRQSALIRFYSRNNVEGSLKNRGGALFTFFFVPNFLK